MNNQFWSGYKGPITQAAGTVAAEYVLVQMCRLGRLRPGDAGGGGQGSRAPATRYYRG